MTAGERWAADELLALRAARFTPAGWRRFLHASFNRAAETRRARPELARQARAWCATGLGAGLAGSPIARRAGIAAPRPAIWAPWWLTTAAMLDWHLGMLEGPGGEHRDRLTTADALTLTRLALVPCIACQGVRRENDAVPFAALLAAAATTDLLDGALSRHTGPTRLGRDLDAAADVLTGLAAVRAGRRAGWLTQGAARLATARYAGPVALVTTAYLDTGRRVDRARFGHNQSAANLVLAGLIATPAAPRLASYLVGFASLATLAAALRGGRPGD